MPDNHPRLLPALRRLALFGSLSLAAAAAFATQPPALPEPAPFPESLLPKLPPDVSMKLYATCGKFGAFESEAFRLCAHSVALPVDERRWNYFNAVAKDVVKAEERCNAKYVAVDDLIGLAVYITPRGTVWSAHTDSNSDRGRCLVTEVSALRVAPPPLPAPEPTKDWDAPLPQRVLYPIEFALQTYRPGERPFKVKSPACSVVPLVEQAQILRGARVLWDTDHPEGPPASLADLSPDYLLKVPQGWSMGGAANELVYQVPPACARKVCEQTKPWKPFDRVFLSCKKEAGGTRLSITTFP